MKALFAALIAVTILYAIDSQYNDGRYTSAVKQVASNLVGR
jgi:hypothetical protein